MGSTPLSDMDRRQICRIADILETRKINRSVVPEESQEPELTLVQYVFLAIFHFWSDVHGLGYSEYLTNTDGQYVNFLPIALAEVGARRTADLVRKAHADQGDTWPDGGDFDENYGGLLFDYLESHRSELPDPSEVDPSQLQAARERLVRWQDENMRQSSTRQRERDRERDHFLHRSRVGDLADVQAAYEQNPRIIYARKPHSNETALHLAARHGHVEVVRYLLDRRIDPNSMAIELHSPLTAALWAVGNPHRGTTDEKQLRIAEMIREAGGR